MHRGSFQARLKICPMGSVQVDVTSTQVMWWTFTVQTVSKPLGKKHVPDSDNRILTNEHMRTQIKFYRNYIIWDCSKMNVPEQKWTSSKLHNTVMSIQTQFVSQLAWKAIPDITCEMKSSFARRGNLPQLITWNRWNKWLAITWTTASLLKLENRTRTNRRHWNFVANRRVGNS